MPPSSSWTAATPSSPRCLDDVGRAEVAGQRLPVGVPRHGDDAVRAEASGRDDGAQAHGPVADHDDGGALPDAGGSRRVVAGAHHVGEREQAREQRIVRPVAEAGTATSVPSAIGTRTASPWPASIGRPSSSSPPHQAPLAHEVCTPLRQCTQVPSRQRERRDHEVADRERRHVGADVLDDADELVPDAVRLGRLGHAAVGPQVRPADAGGGDAHQRVGRPLDRGVGHVLDPDVAGGVDQGGAHGWLPNRRGGDGLDRVAAGARPAAWEDGSPEHGPGHRSGHDPRSPPDGEEVAQEEGPQEEQGQPRQASQQLTHSAATQTARTCLTAAGPFAFLGRCSEVGAQLDAGGGDVPQHLGPQLGRRLVGAATA